DSHRAGIVMDLLRKVALEQEAAILVVTHDEKLFDRFDNIFLLRDGRLDVDGSRPAPSFKPAGGKGPEAAGPGVGAEESRRLSEMARRLIAESRGLAVDPTEAAP